MTPIFEPPTCWCRHIRQAHGHSICFKASCSCQQFDLRTAKRVGIWPWRRWVPVTNDANAAQEIAALERMVR